MLILLITAATGSSTVAAFLVCTIICNPLTYIPLYYLSWLAGNLILPGRVSWENLKSVVDKMQEVGIVEAIPLMGQVSFDAGIVLLIGGMILALPLAVFSYSAARRFFLQIGQKRYEKHLLNKKNESSAS